MTTTTLMPASFPNGLVPVEPYNPEVMLADRQRRALALVGAMLAIGIVGGAIIPIGGAVIGSGQVGAESQIKHISHPTGGTVAQILVENGQHVRKGQPLVRLDDKVSGADASLSALTVDQLLAQKARLEAERLGQSQIVFPDILRTNSSETAQRAMADEQRMFAIRRSEQAGMVSQLTSRIGQYEQQISGFDAQIASLRQQNALIEPERKGLRDLYEKKLVTLSRMNQLERAAVDLNGSIGALTAQIAQARGHISETRQQIIQLADTRRSEAGDQIAQINNQLNQQQLRSLSASDMQNRTVIRAPYDGVVEKLTLTTIGGVIRPADVLMDIVPNKTSAVVEGSVSPQDIDQVHVDQPARVRLSALSVTATPELKGRVIYVGLDKVTSPDGQRSYFPVRVAIDATALKDRKDIQLKTGLPAEIFVETGNRSMISYVLKPLRDQFARTFRDN